MARYFFDLTDNSTLFRDDEGTDLPDVGAARIEATYALTDMARGRLSSGDPRSQLVMVVRDEAGAVIIHLCLGLDTTVFA